MEVGKYAWVRHTLPPWLRPLGRGVGSCGRKQTTHLVRREPDDGCMIRTTARGAHNITSRLTDGAGGVVPICPWGIAVVSAATDKPTAHSTDTPVTPLGWVPDPRPMSAGRFCPPRTTKASSGIFSVIPCPS